MAFDRLSFPRLFSVVILGCGLLLGSFSSVPIADAGSITHPLLLGIYTTASLQVAAGEIVAIDAWVDDAAKKTSIAGTFMDIEFPNPDWNVPAELNAAWDNGYTPFVNLMTSERDELGQLRDPPRTAEYIALGGIDGAIRTWAQEFAAWSNGGEKQAFIALLQEMNLDPGTYGSVYGLDTAGYIAAFKHIQQLFYEEGVSPDAVNWVFAPNGWSAPGDPGFEEYYPGDDYVDLLAFSAYNFGTNPSCTTWPSWDGPEVAFGPYLARLRAMAPTKPIFIAQTASASSTGYDKGQWLIDTYSYLADYPAVRGILYFNIDKECDWAFYQSSGRQLDAYKTAISHSSIGYQHPLALAFDPQPPYTFDDVWRAHPFAGVPDHPDWPYVEALYAGGYTAGCSTDPMLYCPDNAMLRSQSAVFVERGIHGSGMSVPPTPSTQTFSDVPLSHWAAGWIESLWQDEYTAGCATDPLRYCPDQQHTRTQGTVFFETMLNGTSPTLDTPVGLFADVPSGWWGEAWIETAYNDGLIQPCDPGPPMLFCPNDPLTRGMAAYMMVQAKGLPLP
jgi:hypothetical protein